MAMPALLVAKEGEAVALSGFWQDVGDYEGRRAFEVYGPPLPEDADKARGETQLYLDMLANFNDVSEDEDEFGFVAEAFSVPVDAFRPESLRATTGNEGDVFDDDPLPMGLQSSSIYVDAVRLSFLPGPALKPRDIDEVSLGNNRRKALFAEQIQKSQAPEQKVVEEEAAPLPPLPKKKKALAIDGPETMARARRGPVAGGNNLPPVGGTPYQFSGQQSLPPVGGLPPAAAGAVPAAGQGAGQAAGQINAPLSPDEQTLHDLKEAVRALGLEKDLNFEASQYSNQTKVETPKADGKQGEGKKAEGDPGGAADSQPAPHVAPLPAKAAEDKSAKRKELRKKKKKSVIRPHAQEENAVATPAEVPPPPPAEDNNNGPALPSPSASKGGGKSL